MPTSITAAVPSGSTPFITSPCAENVSAITR
jgi:hypothetical protein